MKAVIDRFEGNFAVLLIGEAELKVDLPKALLPAGAKEGSWLSVDLKLDQELTRNQEEKVTSLLERLKNKNK